MTPTDQDHFDEDVTETSAEELGSLVRLRVRLFPRLELFQQRVREGDRWRTRTILRTRRAAATDGDRDQPAA